MKHHLIARRLRDGDGPTVWLCHTCHGQVRVGRFAHNHRELTIAGLQRAKANGVKLGNPRLKPGTRALAAIGVAGNVRNADAVASNAMIYIERARKAGCTTLQEIADALNRRGIPTRRGGDWHPASVLRVLRRQEIAARRAAP
jgi:hypothetical protein